MDCSSPGSSVHGILQARMLEWLLFSSPGDFPDPGVKLQSPALQVVSCIADQFFTKALNMCPFPIISLEQILKSDGSNGILFEALNTYACALFQPFL